MKKLLIVLFVVCLSLVFVCCDSEQLQKFGNTLGGTSGNLINPSGNTEAVSSVTSSVSEAVSSTTISTDTVNSEAFTTNIISAASTEAGKAALKQELEAETEVLVSTADSTATGQWNSIISKGVSIVNASSSSSLTVDTVSSISALSSTIDDYLNEIGENDIVSSDELSQIKGLLSESVTKVAESFDTSDSSSVCTMGTVATVLVFQSVSENVAEFSEAVTAAGGVGNMTLSSVEGFASPILNAFKALDVINDTNFSGAFNIVLENLNK